jgi:23S rRNA (pseudouridine1915-N3)-methyltransferase
MFDEYAERVRRFGVAFGARFVPEVRPGSRFSDAHVREREARNLRDALPERCSVIALSPDGRGLTTDAFTRRLERWSQPLAAFVIGGPLGLDLDFRKTADAVLSLTPMTLPHELARVVIAEQIYRAVTILRGAGVRDQERRLVVGDRPIAPVAPARVVPIAVDAAADPLPHEVGEGRGGGAPTPEPEAATPAPPPKRRRKVEKVGLVEGLAPSGIVPEAEAPLDW